jgi:FkbM family methyltransferase
MSMARMSWEFARAVGLNKAARRLAKHWPFPVRVAAQGGRQMYVDLRSAIGRGLFASGTFDMEAIRPGLEALGEGGTFLDVGANVGFYSVIALDRVGDSGNVYSFEMDPRPLRCLRRTIAEFGYSNIHVTEAAVADIDGSLSFEPKAEHGHNRIERSGGSGRRVASVKLDTWVPAHNLARVDVLKVDVEGAEMLVLEGARETIAKFRPLMLCEAEAGTSATFGYSPADLVSHIEAMGYTTTWLKGVFTPTILATPS